MNLTLFFNALNSIQDYVGANDEYNSLYILVNLQVDAKDFKKLTKANYYTRRRSGIFSSYIYIENRRFKERVFINIYVDPSIDKTVLEIPPMLIQPCRKCFCSCF
jgi:LytS/YehU family sensor histidine kinase